MSTIKTVDDLNMILTVPEVGAFLGISRNNAYFLVKSKGFPAIKIGKQYRIPRDKFISWIDSQTNHAA